MRVRYPVPQKYTQPVQLRGRLRGEHHLRPSQMDLFDKNPVRPGALYEVPVGYWLGLAAVVLAVLAPLIPVAYCGIDVLAVSVPVAVAVLAAICASAFVPSSKPLMEGTAVA